jgi:hypothetical protein
VRERNYVFVVKVIFRTINNDAKSLPLAGPLKPCLANELISTTGLIVAAILAELDVKEDFHEVISTHSRRRTAHLPRAYGKLKLTAGWLNWEVH